MPRRLLLLLALLLACLPAGGAVAGEAAVRPTAKARAIAISVSAPGLPGGGTRQVSAPPDAVQFAGGFSYGEAGAVTTGSLTASASAGSAAGGASATASSEVSGISLFGGEVTVGRVVVRATAAAKPGEGTGDLSQSGVSGLVVLGAAADSSPGARVSLGDWGYALVVIQGGSGTEEGYSGSVTGLELHLTADHGGLPAGTVVQVGYAEVSVEAPPAAAAAPAPPAIPQPGTGRPLPPVNQRPGPAIVLQPPTNLDVKIGKSGYVFPVYGPASFVDTFRAGRARVGWHHGEDIFAPFGAPVLAVADGTVFSVGWNDLGGNRFWLRDDKGNEFYYAHLSAFSPLAVNNARVRAGDVIGFIGNTGDAQGTPPHVHFEIHPVELLSKGYDGVIPPHEYLLAWQRLEDIRISGSTLLSSVGRISAAPPPGAYLLSSSDIASASGLEPGSLSRALAGTAPTPSDGIHAASAPAGPPPAGAP